MSSVQYLRAFISERLTAAAEEIFTVFEKTIVQYEEEVDRQRRLLETVLKPEIKLHRIELPQQHVCKEEEVLTDQQLCPQERNSSLDQEEQEPPQIKEEQEEVFTGQEGEQLVLKQETETCMLTPHCEESDHREPEGDHQLLSHNSPVAESQDQNRRKHLDSESTGNEESNPQKSFHENKNHSNDVYNSPKSEINSNTQTEPPQQHVCKEEEVFTDQQLCPQERSSSLDQEEQEPPQIKEEQKEICTSQEGEQLVLKQETEPCMLTPHCEESDHREPEGEHQLLSHNSPVAESQDQNRRKHVDSGSTGNEEPHPKKSFHENKSHSSNVDNSPKSEINSNTQTGKKSFKCETCGKTYIYKYNLKIHLRTHTGEKPYLCKICTKGFGRGDELRVHMRIHTGEKPYSCQTCGKSFRRSDDLKIHLRSHTGEKPYCCQTCGKCFVSSSKLRVHMRVHTGERRFSCKICQKSFVKSCGLKVHMRIHTGEKPYSCKICQKCFVKSSNLKVHMRIHTGEKPYSCQTCGERFGRSNELKCHIRTHS
ncbi:zinc finger protein 391 [Pleuronectes platessa]|uniref:zinc finger protein 391 n=1 Tax=Pleuronectes platessa TaxID=8262 RepID=UPI00232A3B7A|nr:zinc finger protein 391 [Pleuronectes platessa]